MIRCVLAYSGGLDTSVAIRWLGERYDAEVVTLTIDLGANDRDMETIRARALRSGAIDAVVIDAKDEFVRDYIFPALQANAVYEGEYPLATALGRPLIAKKQVEVARQYGAVAIAHGCTGKGNDQVRFDVTTAALAPDLKVIAPAREWGMTRDEEIDYAARHGIEVPVKKGSSYSIDQNLWGRSCESGVLEDPWTEPPADVYAWTTDPTLCPDEPAYLDITFEKGVPVALDGIALGGVELIQRVHDLAGAHGVGRIDHVENRLVGIKSREIYEAPAAAVLMKAHVALEDLCLLKDQNRSKARIAIEYSDMVYNGLWFSPHREDLAAYVTSTQRHVTGIVRVKLQKGTCTVVGRKSPSSLYSFNLATYDKGDTFDAKAAEGFIKCWGLPVRVHAQVRGVEDGAPVVAGEPVANGEPVEALK